MKIMINPIENENKDRFRSQMVLSSFEQGLASFITERWIKLSSENSTYKQIILREPLLEGLEFSQELVRSVVQCCYLKDLFDIGLAVTEGTQENECFAELVKFSTELEIFNIRNAAAHPNRRFYQYFWFRLAAIVSDPRLVRLGMFDVCEGLERAIQGSINAPPPEWFHKLPETPNNLPNKFDHTSTGLIGRDEERRRLWDDFTNPRKHFFAIVAPGGHGKTALALDFLDELTCSIKGQEIVDAVVFVSIKTNTLTITGLVQHKVAKSLVEIESQICRELETVYSDSVTSFAEAKKMYSDQRVVLCIDNLETLLLDEPNALNSFESELPEKWRLIVTSRIPVDDAVSLPLMPLKLPAAKQLVRLYINSCGYPQPDQSLVDAVAKGAKCNPLAVKLVVDAYVAGSAISDSIAKAVSDTTEFSFSNLIDVLPEPCICVMESLFVDDEISRFSLSEALGSTPDVITKAIHDLCRTSLVARGTSSLDGREIFRLNDQVRELLRFHPKRIEIRQKVEKYLRDCRAQVANKVNPKCDFDRYKWDAIEDNLPEDLKVIVHKVNQATNKAKSASTKLPDVYRQLMHSELDFSTIPTYWRSRARVLWELQDRSAGFECLHKALELDDSDVISMQWLAQWLIEDQRSSEALPYLENLISLGADNPDIYGDVFASHVIGDYLYAQIFLKRFEEVETATNKWIERDDRVGWVKACARIRCFLRWAEDTTSDQSEKRHIYALTEFDSAAQHFGLTQYLENLGGELIEKSCTRLRLANENLTEAFARSCIEFIGKYHQDLAHQGNRAFHEMEMVVPIIKKYLSKWNSSPDQIDDESMADIRNRYQEQGYVIARIIKQFSFDERSIKSYLFARDEKGEDCIVHVSTYKANSGIKWKELKQNSLVAIKRVLQSEGSAKWRSVEAKLIYL